MNALAEISENMKAAQIGIARCAPVVARMTKEITESFIRAFQRREQPSSSRVEPKASRNNDLGTP